MDLWLQALLGGLQDPRSCRSHRIQSDRADVRVGNMLTVADKIDRADLPVRLHMPSMRRREDYERTLRLLLADDHRMLRESLRRSMEEHGFDVVGEAPDGAEAVRLAA